MALAGVKYHTKLRIDASSRWCFAHGSLRVCMLLCDSTDLMCQRLMVAEPYLSDMKMALLKILCALMGAKIMLE